jgi:hypothetical protein
VPGGGGGHEVAPCALGQWVYFGCRLLFGILM